MRMRVLVRPKAGILDPQGQAVERALPALGFAGAANVHVGRLIELDVDDPAQLPEMCRKLLVNPLIEDFEIVSFGEGEGEAAAGEDAAGFPTVVDPLADR
jgi:phosphoribosylformylglycinamidine synthase PurS subunit